MKAVEIYVPLPNMRKEYCHKNMDLEKLKKKEINDI